jgi:hypothetical protein
MEGDFLYMRYKFYPQLFFIALVAICATGNPARAQVEQQQQTAQDEEITTRGAFLTTRPKARNKESSKPGSATATAATTTRAKKSAPPNSANNAPNNSKKSSAKSSGNAKPESTSKITNAKIKDERAGGKGTNSGETGVADNAAASKMRPIGLGYTLFTLGDNGEAVRTNPARQFRTGEAIRLALETNTDGYLYIFHTEDDGEPTMIFPDVRLNGGKNLVNAHVPYEIPSSQEDEEEARWFVFKDPPGRERLYIILTRQPLAGVPTGEMLANYCLDKQNVCPWHPAGTIWTELKAAQEREQVAVSQVKDEGRAQTSDERVATSRGLGLIGSAPPPTVIRMTASSNAKMLVTALDLIHK